MSRAFRLRVADLRRETTEAVSVVFDVPDALASTFRGVEGQHLVLRLDIDGREVRRPYSMSSSPSIGGPLTITVKSMPDGVASVYINNHLRVGDEVSVEPPAGNFVLRANRDGYRTYYLFAGGSGVTPIMSHLRAILHSEPRSHVRMAYANRESKSIIFNEELGEMESDGRFRLVHYLSGSRARSWGGSDVRRRRLDKEEIRHFLADHPPVSQDCRYLICGPPGLMEAVEGALLDLGVPHSDVLLERFTPPPAKRSDHVFDGASVLVDVAGSSTSAVIKAGDTMLRPLIAQGADIPFACESGICGTCMAKLVTGEVHMPITFALSEAQKSANQILLCQAQPTTEFVEATTT